MNELTVQKLKELLEYDAETGIFKWRVKRSRMSAGDKAGRITRGDGYVEIGILGKRLLAHRLAIFYSTGSWPSGCVDHINGNRTDNRISNLRCVSLRENQQNRRKAKVNSKTGLLGVSLSKSGKYRAACRDDSGVLHHIGSFDTGEDAYVAYLEFKRSNQRGCTI